MTGHSLEKAIKKEFSGDIMEGLIAIYRCVTNKAEYFASRLHKSMAGIGTNDKQLIRVIITRCEVSSRIKRFQILNFSNSKLFRFQIDMGEIKTAFERLYGKSLKSWIKVSIPMDLIQVLYSIDRNLFWYFKVILLKV